MAKIKKTIEITDGLNRREMARGCYCHECKHWHRALLTFADGSPADFGICDYAKDDVDYWDIDFCSKGEKREG